MNVRSTERLGPEGRPIPRHCEVAGCAKATRAGKPYCPNHVELHPYVQHLMAEIAVRENEVARVAKRGRRAVDIDGPTAQDVLAHLEVHGDRTVPGLARELNIEMATLDLFVDALERRGRVETWINRRGARVASVEAVAKVADTGAATRTAASSRGAVA